MVYDLGTTRHFPLKTSRRSLVGSAAAALAVAKLAPLMAQESTPVSIAEGDSEALTVLKAAGQAVMALETFTFDLSTTAGSSTIFPGVDLISVVGAVRRPTDLTATLNVKALVQEITISAVSVDGKFYIQDPLSGGAWQEFGDATEVVNMVNPDWLVNAAVNLIQDAKITSQNEHQTLIEGYLDFADSLNRVGGAELQDLEKYLATEPVDVAVWINSDNLIERTELYGPIFESESSDVEKRIELADFNEPVDIEAPAL